MSAVSTTITCDGTTLSDVYQVVSIEIRREVNRIPFAELRLLDGNAVDRTFPASESALFVPGAKIVITARYEGEGGSDQSLFTGIVVRHGVEISRAGSVLTITCKDAAVALTGLRTSAVYANQTDDKIIKTLLSAAKVTAGTIAATSLTYPHMVQYNCTAWDFILSRADVLGLVVVVEDGTLSLAKMAVSGSATKTFQLGIDEINSLEIEAEAEHQYAAIQSASWDPKSQAMTSPTQASSVTSAPGNLTGDTLAKAVGNTSRTLTHPVPVLAGEMQAWADARMARSRMALSRGRVSVPGFAPLKLMTVIALAGLSKRFNGTTVVTGVRHTIDGDGWNTDVQFGIPSEEFSSKPDIPDARSAGLLPPISGLQVGVVADYEDDPNSELRVKVILPGISNTSSAAVWARLCTLDGGASRGFYFRPEPKDEVIVGFLNDDPRCPVILGSVFSSGIAPPSSMGKPDAKNLNRGLVTKSGTTLGFMDDSGKAQVFIKTSGGNSIVFDDDKGTITLTDKNSNSITMDKDGIALKSCKKFTVDASDAVTIKGSKVDVQ